MWGVLCYLLCEVISDDDILAWKTREMQSALFKSNLFKNQLLFHQL